MKRLAFASLLLAASPVSGAAQTACGLPTMNWNRAVRPSFVAADSAHCVIARRYAGDFDELLDAAGLSPRDARYGISRTQALEKALTRAIRRETASSA